MSKVKPLLVLSKGARGPIFVSNQAWLLSHHLSVTTLPIIEFNQAYVHSDLIISNVTGQGNTTLFPNHRLKTWLKDHCVSRVILKTINFETTYSYYFDDTSKLETKTSEAYRVALEFNSLNERMMFKMYFGD